MCIIMDLLQLQLATFIYFFTILYLLSSLLLKYHIYYLLCSEVPTLFYHMASELSYW